MRESLPKQLDQKPEIAAILDDVRSGMARLFHMANETSKTITHHISSEAEFNCQEMEDVEDDGFDDCDDNVYLGGMVDKMAGECNIDRDEAVKRLGAILQKNKRSEYGLLESRNPKAMRQAGSAAHTQCRLFDSEGAMTDLA